MYRLKEDIDLLRKGDIIVPELNPVTKDRSGRLIPLQEEYRAKVIAVYVSERRIVVRFINRDKGDQQDWPYGTFQVVGRVYN